jgi:hypothetical protein
MRHLAALVILVLAASVAACSTVPGLSGFKSGQVAQVGDARFTVPAGWEGRVIPRSADDSSRGPIEQVDLSPQGGASDSIVLSAYGVGIAPPTVRHRATATVSAVSIGIALPGSPETSASAFVATTTSASLGREMVQVDETLEKAGRSPLVILALVDGGSPALSGAHEPRHMAANVLRFINLTF